MRELFPSRPLGQVVPQRLLRDVVEALAGVPLPGPVGQVCLIASLEPVHAYLAYLHDASGLERLVDSAEGCFA